MAIESEAFDVSIRRRKIGNLSNQSSSSDLLNNNNNNNNINNNNDEKFSDCIEFDEKDFDADVSTLGPAVNEVLKETQVLPHDEALDKLKEVGAKTPILPSEIGTDFSFKRQIVWKNAIGFLILHICALVGIFLSLLGYPRVYSVIYSKYFVDTIHVGIM